VEGHSSRLELLEDRISKLKDEIEIKDKTEELLDEQLKSYEKNMQKLVRVESTWVVIHGCMKAIVGISLYTYP
jgi:hypothetical protein